VGNALRAADEVKTGGDDVVGFATASQASTDGHLVVNSTIRRIMLNNDITN
jgi:hypothetical protein